MKPVPVAISRFESLVSDLIELVKARLSFLVLLTTLVGFLLGWRGAMDYLLLTATLIGTALCAFGAAALNQWMERDWDARMKRTQTRPLPGGRMHPSDAFLFGILFSVTGLACLFLFVNGTAAFLAGLTLASYLFIYTPMKRRSELNTLVGAIPGAIPPVIGWVAATGAIGPVGLLLFVLLWLWQMPHFLAISWMYREEYAQAGFRMLSGPDTEGTVTARQALLYSLCLLPVSLVPVLWGLVAQWYFPAVLLLGAAFCFLCLRFLTKRTRSAARLVFFGSILYLPLLLALLLAAKR